MFNCDMGVRMGKKECSFCGKKEREVRKLIEGHNAFICDECIKMAYNIIKKNRDSSWIHISRDLGKSLMDKELKSYIPKDFAERYGIVPVSFENDIFVIAGYKHDFAVQVIEKLKKKFSFKRVIYLEVEEKDIKENINKYYK